MEKSPYNWISVFVGIAITFVLCLIYVAAIHSTDPMYLWGGILAIIGVVFAPGLKRIPIQCFGVLKILGKRVNIFFTEGLCWIPWFMVEIEIVSGKDRIVDVPPIKVLAKDKIEVVVDIWVWWRVKNPILLLNLENPDETVKQSIVSKCNEASWEEIRTLTYNQCLNCKENIQNAIRNRMTKEESELGVEITNIDIRPILPTDEVRKELTEVKKKELKTNRFVKTLKKIKKEVPGATDNEVLNTAQVAEGTVPKKIEEKKTTFKIDVEPSVLNLVAKLLKKEETKEGDKK